MIAVGGPITLTSPVVYPGPPPQQADVVVIGGGIIGVSTALFLARAGQRVVVLEKGRIAAEQSSRNWGWIRQQGRDPHEIPIVKAAQRHWYEFAAEADSDIGLVRAGVTYLAKTERQMAAFAAWLEHARAHDLDSHLVSKREVPNLIPGIAQPFVGALHTPSDMRAEPWGAVAALARIAARTGAKFVEKCAVRALDIADGRIRGVVTEYGRVAAPRVVLAGGAWSSLLLRKHGVHIPQLSVRATVAATAPVTMGYTGGATDNTIAWRQRQDGGLTLAPGGRSTLYVGPDAFRALPKYLAQLRADPFGVGLLPAAPQGFPDAWSTPRNWSADARSPFEANRILDPRPHMGKVEKLERDIRALFPKSGQIKITRAWAGMIDTMPDVVPVIDEVAQLPGLIIGTGMSGHGFGIGPGVGEVLARLATGDDPGHDLHRFRLARFSDGSPMEPGPDV